MRMPIPGPIRLFLPASMLLLLILAAPAALRAEDGNEEADIVTKTIRYEHDGQVLAGHLAYDPSIPGQRPGVLVIHEWWGLGDHARQRAESLARDGYVAFACDMYGEGRLTDDPQQAGAWAGAFRGEGQARQHGRSRVRAGLDVLARQDRVDSDRLAAIGFCFGGTIALELAWSGAPVKAVVSFHGHPTIPRDHEREGVQAALLVCHGAADPLVPEQTLSAFEEMLEGSNVDWTLVKYGGAVHSFTNPAADDHGIDGVAYDARAARRAWQHMHDLFQDVLFDEPTAEDVTPR